MHACNSGWQGGDASKGTIQHASHAYTGRILIDKVSKELQAYAKKDLKITLCAREAGGRGDCFYLSLAAILQQLARQHPQLQTALEDKLGMPSLFAQLTDVAQHVGSLVA